MMHDHRSAADAGFGEPATCGQCPHPAWAHGPGGICSECDMSLHANACGLLSLYGFDLGALPVDDRVGATY